MVAADGGFFDCPIHSLNLPVGRRMIDIGEAMLDPMFPAAHIKHVGDVSGGRTLVVARREPELDAVVCQNCMDLVGHHSGFDMCIRPPRELLHPGGPAEHQL